MVSHYPYFLNVILKSCWTASVPAVVCSRLMGQSRVRPFFFTKFFLDWGGVERLIKPSISLEDDQYGIEIERKTLKQSLKKKEKKKRLSSIVMPTYL